MSRAVQTAKGSPATGSRNAEIHHGDCIVRMRSMPAASVDLVLTDPPYVVRYRSRTGATIANDDNADWLKPAFSEIGRVLKPGGFCISFYGWNAVGLFADAWRAAGLRIVGHLVFAKNYASSSRYLQHFHEQAYVLAKGDAALPDRALADVRGWAYTGNKLHPTQKPVCVLRPLIRSFCPAGGVVLDPFCGSGSTLVAARHTGRHAIGIELDAAHYRTACRRLAG